MTPARIGPIESSFTTETDSPSTAMPTSAVLGESASAVKLVSIGLILAGVIGLNLSGVTPP